MYPAFEIDLFASWLLYHLVKYWERYFFTFLRVSASHILKKTQRLGRNLYSTENTKECGTLPSRIGAKEDPA